MLHWSKTDAEYSITVFKMNRINKVSVNWPRNQLSEVAPNKLFYYIS